LALVGNQKSEKKRPVICELADVEQSVHEGQATQVVEGKAGGRGGVRNGYYANNGYKCTGQYLF